MRAVSGIAATLAIARLSGKRFLRSRVLIIGIVFLFLAFLPPLLGGGRDQSIDFRWEHFLRLLALLQMLVTALFTSQSIAEEIEHKTYAYLWSRPIPRWSVLAGKLVTGMLAASLLTSASVVIGSLLIGQSDSTLVIKATLGISLGVISTGCIASCFGTLIPKHALALSIAYFLILDFSVGNMPFAMARLSVMHNVTAISEYGPNAGSTIESVLWLMGLATFWTLISLRRLARKEFSTGS